MTKEELTEIIIADKKIRAKKETAAALYELATSVPGIDTTTLKVQTSSRSENKIINKYLDLERELKKDIAAVLEKKEVVYKKLQVLDGLEKDIMQLRYIGGLSWDEIADKVNVSSRHVYRIHDKALEQLKHVI
jgi:RNA polymerase sigma factor (sigma-70 family)